MSQISQVISAIKNNSKVSVSLPFLRYELDLTQALDPVTVDERIARLDKIRDELEAAAETLLQVPEDSFARMLARANSKARIRGIVEGLTIGLVTGAISSLGVWYLTR